MPERLERLRRLVMSDENSNEIMEADHDVGPSQCVGGYLSEKNKKPLAKGRFKTLNSPNF